MRMRPIQRQNQREGQPVSSRLQFSRNGHKYYLDGSEVPSVTTILRMLDKPNLVPWAARVAADYAVNNWQSLSEMDPAERHDPIANAHRRRNRTAVVAGTAIHRYAEDLIHGRPVDVPTRILAQVNSLARWLSQTGAEPIHLETSVYTPASDTLEVSGYAGTFDAIVKHPHHGSLLLDWKTGSGPWTEMAYQIAAYGAAEYAVIDGDDRPTPEIDTVGVVMVGIDETVLHTLDPDSRNHAWRRFEALLAFHYQGTPEFTEDM